jgi:hypothetical protein
MRRRWWWLLPLLLALAPGVAAHDVGISQVTLEQQPDGRYVLEVRLDGAPVDAFAPPLLPERCAAEAAAGAVRGDARSIRYRGSSLPAAAPASRCRSRLCMPAPARSPTRPGAIWRWASSTSCSASTICCSCSACC